MEKVGPMPKHVFASPRFTETAQRDHGTSSSGAYPLPTPTGEAPYHLDLAEVLPAKAKASKIIIDVIGDSGCIKDPAYQYSVADAIQAQEAADFIYHVGDVVYFNGQRSDYYDQFYEPYNHLNVPIFAIPGNHDGDPGIPGSSYDPATGETSLEGFMANFCQPQAGVHLPEAEDTARTGMVQPNCYWTMTTNVATIIGLYSNVPEGGWFDATQQAWYISEVASADPSKWLIVACHHPTLSADAYHSGSATVEGIIASGAREPDLVLAGHVHDYQRFTTKTGKTRAVVGAGGYYNLHEVVQAVGWVDPATGATLEAFDDKNYGHLRLIITAKEITGRYRKVSTGPGTVEDVFSILKTA